MARILNGLLNYEFRRNLNDQKPIRKAEQDLVLSYIKNSGLEKFLNDDPANDRAIGREVSTIIYVDCLFSTPGDPFSSMAQLYFTPKNRELSITPDYSNIRLKRLKLPPVISADRSQALLDFQKYGFFAAVNYLPDKKHKIRK